MTAQTDWQSTINLVLGALLGAGLSFAAAHFRDKTKQAASRRQKLLSLLAEMKENYSLSERVQVGAGHAKLRFSHPMWDATKGDIFDLPADLLEKLRGTHSSIARYNTLIEYDLAKVGIGEGFLNQSIEVIASETRGKLDEAVRQLTAYLEGKGILPKGK